MMEHDGTMLCVYAVDSSLHQKNSRSMTIKQQFIKQFTIHYNQCIVSNKLTNLAYSVQIAIGLLRHCNLTEWLASLGMRLLSRTDGWGPQPPALTSLGGAPFPYI